MVKFYLKPKDSLYDTRAKRFSKRHRRILMGYKEETGAQLKGNNKPGLVIHQQGEEL